MGEFESTKDENFSKNFENFPDSQNLISRKWVEK